MVFQVLLTTWFIATVYDHSLVGEVFLADIMYDTYKAAIA